jgi:regulator of protease activity HflC (stomatin/prohibitin superfamily)
MLALGSLPFIALLAVIVVWNTVKVAQEYERAVVFRLGRVKAARGPGLYLLIPFIETRQVVDLRTVTVNIEQQETITRDSVTIKVTAVLWYEIVDPVRATIAVQNYRNAVNAIALTTLRNIIGQHDLDQILRERDSINAMLQTIIDKTTEPWGIQVHAVEMKDVEIPEQMQRAMAQEAQAIREKRARIIKAEAEEEAAQKLTEAAGMIAAHPAALELRRMQMITEVGADQNTTTIIMIPSDFVMAAKAVAGLVAQPPT